MNVVNETSRPKKLYRSRRDRRLGGVCGGLADYLNTDVTVIRVLFVVLFFFPVPTILPYLVMWLVVPEESL